MNSTISRSGDQNAYKAFIDGLRAIAIVAVVAYHAGVPGVNSGFIGVDVFFVISGYLIIGQILAGLASGKFTLAQFWARRTLRILPPYLLVVGACLLAAPFILVTPAEFQELGREAQYSALMVVNYYFLASTGYFDISGELKPLLHLWSLSVEEQFYVFAPLCLIALWWLRRKAQGVATRVWTVAIGATLAFSFLACVVQSSTGSRAFFLMPYRVWEFGLGGMIPLAVPMLRRVASNHIIDFLCLLGLVMILVAATALDGTVYPSFYAALPVVGTCLVIAAGLARPSSHVVRILGTRPFVWVGLLSYAWYLWHWPLLSFGAIHNFGTSPIEWRVSAIVISFLLAAATHHWLEVPIRRWRLRWPHPIGWRFTGIGAAAAVFVSFCGLAFVHLLAPSVERQLIAAGHFAEGDWTFRNDPCKIRGNGRLSSECIEATDDGRYGVLIGNSHARMIYGVLDQGAADEGRKLIAFIRNACTPFFLPEPAMARFGDRCSTFYRKGSKHIETLHPRADFAILSARWNMRTGFPKRISGKSADVLAGEVFGGVLPNKIRGVLALGVGGFINEAKAWGAKRILIVGPVPEFTHSVPECLARAAHRGMDARFCAMSRKDVSVRRRKSMATLSFIASHFPDVRVLDPMDMFCDKSWCLPYDAGGPLYIDGNHLSIYGASRLFERYEQDFLWAIAGEAENVESGQASSRQDP